MSKRNYEQLEGFVVTKASIECDNCNAGDSIYGMDEFEAMPEFFKRGWRVKRNKCHCSKCIKKLKNKQQ